MLPAASSVLLLAASSCKPQGYHCCPLLPPQLAATSRGLLWAGRLSAAQDHNLYGQVARIQPIFPPVGLCIQLAAGTGSPQSWCKG